MNENGTFGRWKDKLAFWTLTTGLVLAVGWGSFITINVMSRPTTADVLRMITTEQKFREEQVRQLKELNTASMAVIEKNTDAITLLRIEIAKLADE